MQLPSLFFLLLHSGLGLISSSFDIITNNLKFPNSNDSSRRIFHCLLCTSHKDKSNCKDFSWKQKENSNKETSFLVYFLAGFFHFTQLIFSLLPSIHSNSSSSLQVVITWILVGIQCLIVAMGVYQEMPYADHDVNFLPRRIVLVCQSSTVSFNYFINYK